jgi:hypothetical protein
VLPDDASGPVTIEIAAADGRLVRRFASGDAPKRPEAEVYFADLWLGEPVRPRARAGHNRFVWDLRLAPPRALAPEYSIAAVPGVPTPALPQGSFVLPGRYEARLIVGGKTLRQPFEVEMDPRLKASEKLQSLFDFQTAVAAELERSATLDQAMAAAEERLRAQKVGRARAEAALADLGKLRTEGAETAAAWNGALASLASDLESADAVPTEPQRRLLSESREAIDRALGRWESFRKLRLSRVLPSP